MNLRCVFEGAPIEVASNILDMKVKNQERLLGFCLEQLLDRGAVYSEGGGPGIFAFSCGLV